jgi:hypothetical protein
MAADVLLVACLTFVAEIAVKTSPFFTSPPQ